MKEDLMEHFGFRKKADEKLTVDVRKLGAVLTLLGLIFAASIKISSYAELPHEMDAAKKDIRLLQDYQIKTETRWEEIQKGLGRIEHKLDRR